MRPLSCFVILLVPIVSLAAETSACKPSDGDDVTALKTRQANDNDAVFQLAAQVFRSGKSKLGLKPLKGQHLALYRASADNFRFCHHPNLIVFRNRLYAMWSNGVVDEDAGKQRVVYRYSSDGENWSPLRVLSHAPAKGACVAVGFRVAKDRLIAFYTVTGGTNFDERTALFARTLGFDGKLSPPQRLVSGFYIEAPHEVQGGRLILAGEHVGKSRETKRMRIMYTDQLDGLGGWQDAKIPQPTLKDFGYTEPNVFRRGNEIVAAFRNYTGHLYASTSADRGKSWSKPTATNFPDSTARFHTSNLPDGRVVLINNPGPKQFDRTWLTLAVSQDGKTFDRAGLVRGETTKKRFEGKHKLDGWQYPHAVVWKDSLWVAYSVNKEDVSLSRFALKDLP